MVMEMIGMQSERTLTADRLVVRGRQHTRVSLGRTNPTRCIEHLGVKNAELESKVEKMWKELKEVADSANELTT